MRSFTLRAVAFFTATCATPLPDELGLPSPNSYVLVPGSLLADTFQIPAGQSVDPTNNLGSEIPVFPPTDAENENDMEASLDVNDNDATPALHVASGPVSPLVADVNSFDSSDSGQFELETALNHRAYPLLLMFSTS